MKAVQCIVCPLCRCECVLPPSGHFPSCVNTSSMRGALGQSNNDNAATTVSSTTQTEQTFPDMMIQRINEKIERIHLTFSMLKAKTNMILVSVGCLCPIMFILGLVSVVLRLKAIWSLQDMDLVRKTIFFLQLDPNPNTNLCQANISCFVCTFILPFCVV